MKFLLGLLLLAFLAWLAVSLLIQRLRRMRGETLPEKRGPRAVTLVSIALIVIYAVLLLWRLYETG